MPADVVAVSESADLALLRLKQPGLPAIPLADEGEQVELLSAAEGDAARLSIAGCAQPGDGADPDADVRVQEREGILLAQRTDGNVNYLILLPMADVGHGWSGGPLFRPATGKVVGVFHALIARKSDPGIWFPQSITTAQLEALLKEAGVQDLAPFRTPPPPSVPRPADAETLFRHEFRADAYLVMRQWTELEAECRAILKLRPDNARTHTELAIALEEQGRHDEALAQFEESVRRDPTRARTHLNYGIALQSMGRLAEAEAKVRKATELAPEEADAWAGLGRVLLAEKQHEEAISALRKAVSLSPEHPLIRWNLGISLVQGGKVEDGVAELRAVAALAEQLTSLKKLRLGLAQLLQTLGRLDAAETEYRAILQDTETDSAVHFCLAGCLQALGKQAEALKHARRCLELQPPAKVEAAARALIEKLEKAGDEGVNG
jgi:tetratricopeptide (TPR) repeat protein